MRLAAMLTFALLGVVGCPGSASAPVRAPMSPLMWVGSDAASQACRHLQELSCPLGNDPHCEDVFRLDAAYGMNPACVNAATTIPALKACRVECD